MKPDPRDVRAARLAEEHRDILRALITVDYASFERRILEAAGEGQDPYRQAAAMIFGVAPERVTEEQRHAGKIANSFVIYNAARCQKGTIDGLVALLEGSTISGRILRAPDVQNVKPPKEAHGQYHER